MNEIKYNMPLTAIVEYLIYRRQVDAEKTLFETFTADHIAIMASNKRLENVSDYREMRNKIWNIKSAKKDERTAKQIIDDTLKKHNITICEERG